MPPSRMTFSASSRARVRRDASSPRPARTGSGVPTSPSTQRGRGIKIDAPRDAFVHRIAAYSVDCSSETSLTASVIRNAVALRSPRAPSGIREGVSQLRSRTVVRLVKSHGSTRIHGPGLNVRSQRRHETSFSWLRDSVLATCGRETRENYVWRSRSGSIPSRSAAHVASQDSPSSSPR